MENKKNVVIAILLIGVISMTIAFAAFSTNLSISGTADVSNTTWNIHFQNWALDTANTVTEGGITHQNTADYPTVNQLTQLVSVANSTKVENLNVTLNQPGDYVKYTFQIINEGSIDASLNNFTHTMTCESGKTCDHLTYTVECKDSQENNVLTQYSTLYKNGGLAYCTLQVKYNEQTNTGNTVYTQEAVSASLSANWQYIQKVDSNSGNSGQGGNSGSGEPGGSGQSSEPEVITPVIVNETADNTIFAYNSGTITGFKSGLSPLPTEITIPDTIDGVNITSISGSAFAGRGLTSVTLSSTLTTIGGGSFPGNQISGPLVIPENISTIEASAFAGNPLSSVIIQGAPTIGNNAFYGPNLSTITLTATEVDYGSRMSGGITNIPNLVIADSVESVAYRAFYGIKLNNVVVNADVINEEAFENCSITSVSFGNTVTDIKANSFYNNSIQTLEIPNSVTTIRTGAFANNNLSTVTLGTGVQEIAASAFMGNSSLTSIINRTGRAFNWCSVLADFSDQSNCTFETGTLGNVTITNQ